jgi:hypothetical protein
MHSMGVWSVNHDVTTSLGLAHTPIFLKFTPHLLHKPNSVGVDSCIKVLTHFVYDIVRLAQTGPSLAGNRASLKAIPATKYPVVTISHSSNTMTSQLMRDEKGHMVNLFFICSRSASRTSMCIPNNG